MKFYINQCFQTNPISSYEWNSVGMDLVEFNVCLDFRRLGMFKLQTLKLGFWGPTRGLVGLVLMEKPQKVTYFFILCTCLVRLGLSVLGANWRFQRLGVRFLEVKNSRVEGLTRH